MSAQTGFVIDAPEAYQPAVGGTRTPRPEGGWGRGRDPRLDGREALVTSAPGRGLIAGASVLIAVTSGFAALALTGTELGGRGAVTMTEVLAAAASTLALIVFVLCAVRSHLVADATVLRVGTAVLVFGLFCIAIPEIVLPVTASRPATAAYAQASHIAGLLGALALLALAVGRSDGYLRTRAGPLFAGAIVATSGFALALRTVPSLLPRVPAPEQSGAESSSAAAAAIIAAALLLTAVACAVRGFSRRRPLLAWSGLMLLALGVSFAGLALARHPDHPWIVGGSVLRLLALLFAVAGVSFELEQAFAQQRAQLLDVEIAARTTETRWRVQRASRRDRDHEMRSALVAIEGAALTLERHYETLSREERDRLTALLSSGVDRLQRLVIEDSGPRAAFTLAEVVTPFAGNLTAEGGSVAVEVPEDMIAFGSPAETAEVVRQLLDNARRRAPGGTIRVRGEHDGAAVVLRFDDGGPAGPATAAGSGAAGGSGAAAGPARWRTLTEPTPELPLALHVASRLMKDQGGDLWLEADGPGRCTFALSLPGPAMRSARS